MRVSRELMAGLIFAAASVGCAALGRQAFAKPTVTLANVRVTGIGITGGSLEVDLKVHNPNNYRLDATRFHYELQVDSTTVARGANDSRITVQAKDSAIVPIPVAFSYAGVGAAGRSVWAGGAVNYHITGDVTVVTPLGDFTVPFVQQGRFSTTGIKP